MKIKNCYLSVTLLFVLLLAQVANSAPENTTADAVLGQVNFTSNLANQGGAAGATTLNGNRGLYVDSTGRLWVADTGNNRVLMYSNAAAFMNGAAAELVLGQVDFTGDQPNRGGANPAQNTLAAPRSVAVDPAGRVYVADSDNKRILRFDPPLANGMNAVQVFGQAGSFTTANQAPGNAATADNLGNPDGVAVDSAGNLYLADLFLKRVLIYITPAAAGGDTTADIAIGQPDLTSSDANQGGANPAANTLFNPEGVALDAQDNLYVADQENHRVLLFKPPFTTNMNATRVYGQPDFTTSAAPSPPNASSLNTPVAVAVDPKSGNLYVADSINFRILEFTDPQNDSTADRVFGQLGDFTTKMINKGGISADSINDVAGVACDLNGNLFAGDRLNNRALRYLVAPPAQGGNGGQGGGGDAGGGAGNGGGDDAPAAAPCGLCGGGAATMMPMVLGGYIVRSRRRRVVRS